MKKVFPILILLFFSCQESTNSSVIVPGNQKANSDSTQEDSAEVAIQNMVKDINNITDSNNLKQGKWITKGYKNKIVKIETFKNDTLNGYWFNWEGMQKDGNYSNGKKDGYFRVYYGDRSEQVVAHLQFYKYDSLLWSAFPAADSESAFPVKGFTAYKDSVLVKAPHVNGELWYKGLFIENEPRGIHSIFDRNGKLLAKTNYSDSTVTFTKYADDEFIETSKMMSTRWVFLFKRS